MRDPPWQWDLRRAGWALCRGEDGRRAECRHVLLVDARRLRPAEREAMVEADRPAWRLLMLGIEEPAERAALLTLGCAEALPATVPLSELAARARRIDEMFHMLPRWRTVGPLTLDLFHRDARRAARWLALHPREFGVLWRLADAPGKRVTRGELLRDVWRLNHEPETNSVEVHVSRLRSKLAELGCDGLVATDPRGGYRLADARPFMHGGEAREEDMLDAYVREHRLWPAEAAFENG
jgi:DNA-binding winged helix-turn-helix (wHTH) protein